MTVTLSVENMSRPIAPRLPYDDAVSPHEMFGDCQAAGAALGVAVTPDQVSPALAPPASQTDLRQVAVPASAAQLAGSLHLHLN
ncbi:hypothetical protein NODU109028_09660 [Nocardioides dubius]|uniref:PASTA domain-containing protein n=2 Tax=Nocardioides dubius TaxID=317019 RepID=A0ABN1TNE9_9ACTN